jgi:hypothetical protein
MTTRYHLGVQVPATADAAGIMGALATVFAVAADVDTGASTSGNVLTWTRDTTAGSEAIYSNAFGPRNSRIIIAIHDAGTPTPSPTMVATADTYTAANVLIGLCDNATGAYAGWNQSQPFSGCTFAGYYRMGATAGATLGEIRVWLSLKDLWIQYRYNTSIVVAAHFGAVVTGASPYAESDGYRYGGLVSGALGDMSGVWRSNSSSNQGFLGKNGIANGQPHSGLYEVSGTSWQPMRMATIRMVAASVNMAKWATGPVASREGIPMQYSTSPEYTVGSWSGIADGPLGQSASIVNDSTPALWGWVLSASVNTNEDSVVIGKVY